MFHYILSLSSFHLTNESPHDKSNKMTCAPSKDSDQPGHQSSLSTWRNIGLLTTYWAHSENSDQTGLMPRLIWIFAGRTSFCFFFLLQCGSYYYDNKHTNTKYLYSSFVPLSQMSVCRASAADLIPSCDMVLAASCLALKTYMVELGLDNHVRLVVVYHGRCRGTYLSEETA